MNLFDLLHESCIQPVALASGKDQVLRFIGHLPVQHRSLRDWSEEDTYQKFVERESTGSTGFGDGIAIPYCALENLTDFVLGIVTIPKGGLRHPGRSAGDRKVLYCKNGKTA